MNGKVIEMPKAKKEAKKKAGIGRTRNFASIVYPESAPDDWISILEEEHIPILISPLHDKDICQSAEKQPKKPHYHIIVMYSSVKTDEQARELLDKVNAVGCEHVQSIRGYARYLCHLDNPDKHRYSENNIIALSGADYYSVKELETDNLRIIKEMCYFVQDNDIEDIDELIEYAMVYEENWFRILATKSTLFMREYIRSRAFRKLRNSQKINK